ncbi:MAG: hypothetical protein IKS09_00095 [Lachnospiraceae bacterium]|nr:hypothetical protein [Lachnospiraceae bacterium]
MVFSALEENEKDVIVSSILGEEAPGIRCLFRGSCSKKGGRPSYNYKGLSIIGELSISIEPEVYKTSLLCSVSLLYHS